jgi:hypothetical protein
MPATHNAFHDPINAGTKTNDHVVGPLFINLLKNLLAGRDAQGDRRGAGLGGCWKFNVGRLKFTEGRRLALLLARVLIN